MVISNALLRKEYERIFMCNTAKEIWKTLLITHQGNSQVKDNKIDLLVQQYEQFIVFKDESIDSAFARFNTIITGLKALDEGYSSKNYVRKLLKALHPKWRANVMAIEESKDLMSLSLDELIGNLKVYEMIIMKDFEIVKANVVRKSLALKARKESSDEECLNSKSEDEEYAVATFQRSSDDKNDKSDRKCFRCGDLNHLIGECPKATKDKNQREFVGGSWSDGGEEDDEKVNNETCLVAQASSEVIEFDDSYKAPQEEAASESSVKKKGRTVVISTEDMQKRRKMSKREQLYSASISHDTVCAYIASQSNGSQIKYENINQIDEDDINEMDIKWNMALLSSKEEEPAPKALMAIDGVRWDWSYMANEEENHALVADDQAPTEFALMAKSSSSSENEKEKDVLDSKLTGFESASKDLDTLIGSQRSDKNKEGLAYSAVPPPPPKKDMSWTGLPEFVDDTITDYSRPSPSIESNSNDPQNSNSSIFKHGESSSTILSKPMIKFVKAADSPTDIKTNKVETVRKSSVGYAKIYRNTSKSPKFDHLAYDCSLWVEKGKNRPKNNLAHKKVTPKADLLKTGRTPRAVNRTNMNSAQPKRTYFAKTTHYYDSGCSRHITGNISYLSEYEPYDGGYVSFGQRGGKITGKGIIKTASADESNLWHTRLGHLDFKTMNKLVRHNLDKGLPPKCFENDRTCIDCLKGKQHKASCKTKFVNSVSKPLHTLHMDMFGPTSVIAEAVNTASYVQNMILVNKSQNKTPYELFNSRTPAIGFLRPFGCHVMILNTLDHLGKFDAKANEGYFIGYSMSSKAFKVFNKRTKKVEENLHVDFLKNKLIEKGAGPNWLFDIDTLTNSINYVPVVVAGTSSTNISGTKDAASQGVKKDVSFLRYIALLNWFQEAHIESSNSDAQDARNADAPESSGNFNPTATSKNTSLETTSGSRLISKRVTSQDETPSLDNISTLSNRFKDILRVTTNTVDTNGVEADLSNMESIIPAGPTPTFRIHKDHPKSQIISPMDTPVQTRHRSKEMEEHSFIATIHQKTTPDLLQFYLFSWVRPIGTKRILKNKKDERGILIRNKARLVAQGHTQEEGIDYEKVFAPVARIEAIRLFLAYASFMGFTVNQMDVKSAFLYGTIDKEFYVIQPPGFQDLKFLDRVYKVEKAMYGLHQAPRAWYDEPASLLRDVSQREAFLTVFGLEARQDRENIIKTSALPHDSTPKVTSLDADEGSMQQQLQELTNLCTHLQRKQTKMATKIEAQDLEISNLKAKVKLLEDKDKGTAKQSGDHALIKGRSLETRKEAGVERSTERGSNNTEEMSEAELTIGEKIDLINELVKYKDHHAKILKYQAQGMTLEEIREKFIPVWKQIEDFIPMASKEEAKRFKRKGLRLEQDSAKKMKTSEDVSEEDLKEMMQLVPVEEVYVEALQVKHPIID
nr:putative ribonuclease H-like domain-containing protein [Tanacetum cinerariifolium]